MEFRDILSYLSTETAIILGVSTLALVFGVILQRVVIPRLRKRTARNQSYHLRVFLTKIEGPILIWIILGTFYGLTSYFQVAENSTLGIAATIALIILIITFVYVLSQVIGTIINYYIRKGKLPNTTIFSSLASILILIIGITMILATLGFSITPLFAALGVGGLAVALALQPTLANLFAGISIIASKQINPGDFVQLNPTESGYIDDIQWRTTSIRTIQNNLIIIPNSVLANLTVTNYSLPAKELSVPIMVGVHYDSDLDLVRDVCIDVGKEVLQKEEGGVKDFEPRVRFRQFGPSSIDLTVVLRVNEFTTQYHIQSEFIRILRKRFKEKGIVIPYPITTVEFSNNPPSPLSDSSDFP